MNAIGGTVRPAIDLTSPIQSLLAALHARYAAMTEGAVATYIPELAKADPEAFGIAIVTTDGFVYEAGDARLPFTVQSISKPLVYGLALADHGREAVLQRIGVEPAGEPFNAIRFDEKRNRPFNAMINAGAITATSLIKGADAASRMARILDHFEAAIGHPVGIDEAVYRSEAATGHRNRALAYMALNGGMIEGDPEIHLDLYFRQCSILASAVDIAFIGATLANGGVHPLTGRRALAADQVRDVLSVLTSCGMYDFAGEWELRVGLPAKSGVGGGIMAVLPGQLGIGVFSPRLDERGNSVRGLKVCEDLAAALKLHLLDDRGSTRSALRRLYRGAEIRSTRLRPAASRDRLDRLGNRIAVFELHGNLYFGNTDLVIRRVLQEDAANLVVVDLTRVVAADAVAVHLLREMAGGLAAFGRHVLLAGASADLAARLGLDPALHKADVDGALQACEDALLGAAPISRPSPGLADFELLQTLDVGEREILERHLVRRGYASGQVIIRNGTPADSLYFLMAGAVDITLGGESGARPPATPHASPHSRPAPSVRLGTIEAGNAFGELALLGDRPRTADVVAAGPVTVLKLKATRFAKLATRHPDIHAKLLLAVGRLLADRLRRANTAIHVLSG